MDNEKVYICLADGHIFEGKRFSAGGNIEESLFLQQVCSGYIETLTDPSYLWTDRSWTFPLIGNYGFIDEDCESKRPYVSAYISSRKMR